jgi:4-amino-4-deoxy-L-arabinose transferase-like glycosyltransferase
MKIKQILQKIDKFLDQHTTLWFFLLLMVVLRVPNFFDPYWYGDEAIYLTVGQSMRSGKQLYSQIVDHKTPIIYYLAAVPNQFWFRVLLMIAAAISIGSFYFLSRKIFKKKVFTWVSLLIFVLLTTLPWFEGHIPNGELFVLAFVLVGMWLASKSGYLQAILEARKQKGHQVNFAWLSAAGAAYGLAILTKVPAFVDLAALLSIAWFNFSQKILEKPKNWLQPLKTMVKQVWPILIGTAIPIILSILYFVSRKAGQDYLRFGLLYNLHYTQSWKIDFDSQILNFFISLPGKTLLLGAAILVLSLIKQLSIKFKFFLAWLILSLYSVMLSNRPYPHYFIQAIPSLAWLTAAILEKITIAITTKKQQLKSLISAGLGITVIVLCGLVLKWFGFGTYSVKAYYQTFSQYLTEKINQEEYYQSFNPLMKDNYELARFLKLNQVKNLFIWGDNPMLYALSQTIPTSRFTVAFHISDMNAYKETVEEIKQKEPPYIVVMKNAPNNYVEFFQYLDQHYIPNHDYRYMKLYKQVEIPN